MSCTLPAAESPRPLCGRTHQNTGIWHHHQLLPSVIVQEGRRRWVLLEGCHTGGPSEKRQSLHEGQTWQLQPGVRHRSVGLRKDGERLDQTQAKKIQKVSWHHWGRWFRMDAGLMGLKADGWGLQLLKGTMDVSYKRSPTENMPGMTWFRSISWRQCYTL